MRSSMLTNKQFLSMEILSISSDEGDTREHRPPHIVMHSSYVPSCKQSWNETSRFHGFRNVTVGYIRRLRTHISVTLVHLKRTLYDTLLHVNPLHQAL